MTSEKHMQLTTLRAVRRKLNDKLMAHPWAV